MLCMSILDHLLMSLYICHGSIIDFCLNYLLKLFFSLFLLLRLDLIYYDVEIGFDILGCCNLLFTLSSLFYYIYIYRVTRRGGEGGTVRKSSFSSSKGRACQVDLVFIVIKCSSHLMHFLSYHSTSNVLL